MASERSISSLFATPSTVRNAPRRDDIVLGVGLATLAFVMLSLVDVLVKFLGEGYSVFQMTTVRGLIACLIMLAILGFSRINIR